MWRACRLVRGVRAVGMLAHEGRTPPDLGNGRLGEGVEEIVLGEHQPAPAAFGVDIVVWFEWLLHGSLRCGAEAASWESELGRGVAGKRRWPQLRAGALYERQALSTRVWRPHLELRAPNGGEMGRLRQSCHHLQTYRGPRWNKAPRGRA